MIDCCKSLNTTYLWHQSPSRVRVQNFRSCCFRIIPLSPIKASFLRIFMEKGLGGPCSMPPELISFQGPVLAKKSQLTKTKKAPKSAQDPMTARTALWGRCSNLHKQGRVLTPLHCSGTCRIRPFHRGLAAESWSWFKLGPYMEQRGEDFCSSPFVSWPSPRPDG